MNLCLQRNFVQKNVEGGSLEQGQLWLLFRDGLYPDGLITRGGLGRANGKR